MHIDFHPDQRVAACREHIQLPGIIAAHLGLGAGADTDLHGVRVRHGAGQHVFSRRACQQPGFKAGGILDRAGRNLHERNRRQRQDAERSYGFDKAEAALPGGRGSSWMRHGPPPHPA